MNLNFYCQFSGSSKGKLLLYFGVKKQCHLNVRCVTNSRWDKQSAYCKKRLGDKGFKPNPYAIWLQPKNYCFHAYLFLANRFYSYLFPSVGWFIPTVIDQLKWQRSVLWVHSQRSSSMIRQGINMFLLLHYKNTLWKCPEVSSYEKANVGVKHSGIDCMCNSSLLSLQYSYFCRLC